jgi:putative membrane protein
MNRPIFHREPAAIRDIASACRYFAEDEDMWMSGGFGMSLDGCRDHGDIVRIILDEEFLASRGNGRGSSGSGCVPSGSSCIAGEPSLIPSGSNCIASGSSYIPSGPSYIASTSSFSPSGSSFLRAPEVASGADQVTSRAEEVESRADQVDCRADEVESRADQVDCRADEVASRADQVCAACMQFHPQRTKFPFQQMKLSLEAVRVPRGARRAQTKRPQTVTRGAQVCPSKHPDGYIEALL